MKKKIVQGKIPQKYDINSLKKIKSDFNKKEKLNPSEFFNALESYAKPAKKYNSFTRSRRNCLCAIRAGSRSAE